MRFLQGRLLYFGVQKVMHRDLLALSIPILQAAERPKEEGGGGINAADERDWIVAF